MKAWKSLCRLIPCPPTPEMVTVTPRPFLLVKYMKKLIYGVGINDSEKSVSIYEIIDDKPVRVGKCKIYTMWWNILRRCYSADGQEKQPTYKECTVATEWQTFSKFRDWVISQDWEGKEIDKDILFPGNKIYSPERCVFVDSKINVFLTERGACRGVWPIGVCYYKHRDKYRSSCGNPFTGKLETLGMYNTSIEAHEAWRLRKHQHACRYADMQTDPRIANALRNRYSATKEDI